MENKELQDMFEDQSNKKSNEEILLEGGTIDFQHKDGNTIHFDLDTFYKYRAMLKAIAFERANYRDLEYQRELLKEKEGSEEFTRTKRNKRQVFSIAYDITTDKVYEGINGWINDDHETPSEETKEILPEETVHYKDGEPRLTPGNCAEIDAVDKAVSDGAKLENLLIYTISFHPGKFNEDNTLRYPANSIWSEKTSCTNCTFALNGNIAFNYSGWTYPDGKDPKEADWSK